MKTRKSMMIGTLAGFFLASSVMAVPITYFYEGTIINDGALGDFAWSAGDTWTSSYSFDTDFPSNTTNLDYSSYELTAATFSLTTGGFTYNADGLAFNSVIQHNINLSDASEVNAISVASLAPNVILNSHGVTMSGDFYDNSQPPYLTEEGNPYNVSSFLNINAVFLFTDNSGGNAMFVEGSTTAFQVLGGGTGGGGGNGGDPTAPVPEPTTVLLFGSGLLGLAAVGRRRRS